MPDKTRLDNGVRVLTERIDHVRSVTLGVWVDVGSRDESWEQAGLSHLVEHMIFKGTEKRSALEIALEIDAIGGLSNAFTSREQTCFHCKVLDTHTEEMVELLTDIFLNSTFAPEELAREREVVLQEIKMVEDTPDEQAHTLMPTVLWPGEALGRPILGRAETVGAMSQADLKEYIQAAYSPDRIIIAAVGQLDHQEIIKLVEPTFGRIGPRPGRPPRNMAAAQPGDVIKEKDLEQVHLCLGLNSTSAVDPDRYPAALLNVILGGSMSSRLFQEVREKRGLAYAVYSYLASYSDAGFLGVYMGVDPTRTREALEVALDVMTGLARNGLDGEELYKAKEHLKGQIFLSAESTDNRMNRMAKNEYNFGRYITYDEIAEKIDATTPEDIARVAARLLDPTRMALVALGPGVEDSLGDDWYRG